jgi:hypothetical protein
MDQPRTPRNRRLSPRRPPRGKARIACYKGTLDLGRNLALSLLEVSELGARLTVSVELEPRQEVVLSLEGQGHLRPVKIPATVIWCQSVREGRYAIGVRFDKHLAYQDLIYLT